MPPARSEYRIFQSTHPVGGGTVDGAYTASFIGISIHPPRGGWDQPGPDTPARIDISIHPPRGGWDLQLFVSTALRRIFQSTHPVGGGTWRMTTMLTGRDISIHPPRGGWDPGHGAQAPGLYGISIHPPRGGWDRCPRQIPVPFIISIHPPRGGWDCRRSGRSGSLPYFNPPTPWGVGLPPGPRPI